MRHQSRLPRLVSAAPVTALVIALVTALTTVATNASAAEVTLEGNPVERTAGADAKFSFGGDLALVVPIGGFSDAAGVGVGLLLRFEYELTQRLNLTGRLGYVYHFSHSIPGGSVGASEVPLWGGIKYFPFGDAVNDGFYLAPEVGLLSTTARVSTDGGAGGSASSLTVGATATVGYTIGNLDFRGGFMVLDLGHLADSLGITFNAGYTFLRF